MIAQPKPIPQQTISQALVLFLEFDVIDIVRKGIRLMSIISQIVIWIRICSQKSMIRYMILSLMILITLGRYFT